MKLDAKRIMSHDNFFQLTIPSIMDSHLIETTLTSLTLPRSSHTIHAMNREVKLASAFIELDIGAYNITTLCAELQSKLGSGYNVTHSTSNRVSIENTNPDTTTLELQNLKTALGYTQDTLTLVQSTPVVATQSPDLYGARTAKLYVIESLLADTVSSVTGNEVAVSNLAGWRSSGHLFVAGTLYAYTKNSTTLTIDSLGSNSNITASASCYDVRLIESLSASLSEVAIESRINFQVDNPVRFLFLYDSSRTYWLHASSQMDANYEIALPTSGEPSVARVSFKFI